MDTIYRIRPSTGRSQCGYVIFRENTSPSGHKQLDELIWVETLKEAQDYADLMNRREGHVQ